MHSPPAASPSFDLKAFRSFCQEYLKELEESGETQLLLTDPEARRMHSKDGFHCCYNVQTAVDGGSHLIAEYEVTNHNTDQGLLKETAEGAKKILETDTIEAVADKGYESRADILDCVMNGIVPNVALKYDKEERTYAIDYVENEITEEIRNSTKPADIQKCISAGVLPKFYAGTAIEVALQTVGTELLQFERGRHGDMSDGMYTDEDQDKRKEQRLCEQGSVPAVPKPVHKLRESQDGELRPEHEICAGEDVRQTG